ncbi:MAG: hypothetical protein ACI81A_002049, partial [Paraglaciecola sp.]
MQSDARQLAKKSALNQRVTGVCLTFKHSCRLIPTLSKLQE